MKRLIYIVFVCALCTVFCSPVRAQDYARLGERTIMGTARYVGMGGAMSAIGGDPSATKDNVAGLGLYRREEVMLTFDYSNIFMAPQASVVFSFETRGVDATCFHNLMISYNRLHTYNREIKGVATNSPSLGALFATTEADLGIPYTTDRYNMENDMYLDEYGYVNEFNIDYAMNISEQWYWGAGLHIESYSFTSKGDYAETFPYVNEAGALFMNRSLTTLQLRGVGCSFATGFIYRPLSWLRMGLGVQTPSLGSLTTYTSGTFEARTDSLCLSDAPNQRFSSRDFHMPLHTSASVAFQISQYGYLSLQYDYFKTPGEIANHSLRAGIEVVPVTGLYINAGYAYESPFRSNFPKVTLDETLNRQDTYFLRTPSTHYASGAIGFRGRWFMVQAAYQYRLQRTNLYAHENVIDPYRINTNTHRIVVTIGWHR
jgi:hypothetical protein